jgi:hypothetical protein
MSDCISEGLLISDVKAANKLLEMGTNSCQMFQVAGACSNIRRAHKLVLDDKDFEMIMRLYKKDDCVLDH